MRVVTANVSQTIPAFNVQCTLAVAMSYALMDVSAQLQLTATSARLTQTGTTTDVAFVTKTTQETSVNCTVDIVITVVVLAMDQAPISVTTVLITPTGRLMEAVAAMHTGQEKVAATMSDLALPFACPAMDPMKANVRHAWPTQYIRFLAEAHHVNANLDTEVMLVKSGMVNVMNTVIIR